MVNPLQMSDEDFLKQEMEMEFTGSEEEPTSGNSEDEVVESEASLDAEDDTTESEEEDESEEESNEEDTDSDNEEDTSEDDSEDTGSQEEVFNKDVESTEEDKVEEPTDGIDYKAEYEKLFQPIKANGTTLQLNSIEEAITLIQKGANYHEKMVALKPNLKILKMLENNSLLNEEKLSYLIDLDKKNPEAIQKLIKDSGLDPLDVDVEKDSNYTPNKYSVSDQDMQLDEVLEEIKSSPSFRRTIDIVGSKWDEKSQILLQNNPGLIKDINAQVEDGTYDKVTSHVQKLKLLGQLEGLSDFDAYVAAGNSLFAQNQPRQEVNTPVERKPVIKAESKPNVVKKRKLAASTSQSTSTGSKPETKFNPLAMSDEEFERQFG